MGEVPRLANAETMGMRRGGWVSAATGGFGALVAAHALSSLVFGTAPHLAGLNLTNVASFGATALMVRRAVMPGQRRIWLPLAIGMSFYSLGFLVYAVLTVVHGHVATPSAADPFWLALYPGAYVTIVLLVRRRVFALDAGLWLDGLVAALATTALGAAFAFRPVFDAATGGSISVATKLAYPLGDVVLLALVGGAVVLTGGRPARTWLLLGGGLVVFGIGDVDYATLAKTGPWTAGQVIDVAWAVGLLMLAAAAWEPPPDEAAAAPRGLRRLALAVPSAGVAVALLVVGSGRIGGAATGLATATLLCALLRMAHAVGLEGRLEATRAQALTDDLTQLGNRRLLVEDLDRVVAVASPDAPAALVLFDLNGFKHYNDTFGHLEGDRLLAELARRLELAVRDRGSAYRLGGDEFCALVTGDPRELDGLLPELEAALGEAHEAGTVGCSYGLALIPHEAQTANDALALADRRMYERKDRDRRSTRLQMRDLLLAVVQEQRPDLHTHSTAVSMLARTVSLALGMSVNEVDVVVLAAELHDIGKVAIPDLVLGKPGPLDEDEWRLMRTHTIVGERLLCAVPTLEPVGAIVRSTHERWDGLGYPDGLSGEAIPLAARVVAACDAFDAMLSERPYCPGLPLQEAVRELRGNAGSQFDPAVVEALVEVATSSDVDVHRTRARSIPAESRLSTIASLRGLLDVTRLVRRAGSLSSVLEAIARTMSDSLGLDTVVINLRRPGSDVFDVVTVHGSDEVRDALLNTVNGWEEWAPLLDARFHRRGAYHIRAGELDWTALEGNRVVVGAARGDDAWLWQPEDELFVPFYASDGTLLGVFSVGEPRSGRRPSDEELDVLVAMAEHAAAAVESLEDAPVTI
jgi:two-component system, cell cycle response regulator